MSLIHHTLQLLLTSSHQNMYNQKKQVSKPSNVPQTKTKNTTNPPTNKQQTNNTHQAVSKHNPTKQQTNQTKECAVAIRVNKQITNSSTTLRQV